MDRDELLDRLIRLGANKLTEMFHGIDTLDHNYAHYFKGSFQALKEVAQILFGIDSTNFRSYCMALVPSMAEAGEVTASE
jgi:hypothetical protein